MKKLISVITSAYNEQGCVEEFARQLKEVFAINPAYDFEVIVVENGSIDDTFKILMKIHKDDPRFKIVQLSRNFRMDGGITAGLKYASGDAAVLITANLQDRPQLITEFIKKWEEGYDHIYGIVQARPGKGVFRRVSSQLFYFLINKMTGSMIPKNASDFRLVDKKVYSVINSMEERNRFTRGLFAWMGFKSVGVEFERAKRFAGESHAHFWKVSELALKGIFSFSYLPIQFISAFGIILSGISLLYLLVTLIDIYIKGVPFAGYGTIVSLILLMFGITFFILGILGEYISLIYEEVKARPNYIVSREIGFSSGSNGGASIKCCS